MYQKHTWLPRIGVGLNKFQNLGNAQHLELEPEPDSITQEGTPFSADWMNNLETGIARIHRYAGGAGVTAAAAEAITAGDVCCYSGGRIHKYTDGALRIGHTAEYPYLFEVNTQTVFLTDTVGILVEGFLFRIITLAGDGSFTVSSNYWEYATGGGMGGTIKLERLTSETFALMFREKTAGHGQLVIGRLTGGNIVFSQPTEFLADTFAANTGTMCALDEQHILMVFRNPLNSNVTACRVYSVTGLSVTLAAQTSLDASCYYFALAKISTTAAIVTYTNASGQTCARIITVSGATITAGSTTIIDSANSAKGTSVAVLDRCAVAAVITSGYLLKLIRLTISGTGITAGTALSTSYSAGSSGGWAIAQLSRIDKDAAAVTFANVVDGHYSAAAAAVLDSGSALSLSPIVTYNDSTHAMTMPRSTYHDGTLFTQSGFGKLKCLDVALPRLIALNSAASGGEIDAAYDGDCLCDGLSEGTRVTSPGVSGFAFAEGRIAVTGYWR